MYKLFVRANAQHGVNTSYIVTLQPYRRLAYAYDKYEPCLSSGAGAIHCIQTLVWANIKPSHGLIFKVRAGSRSRPAQAHEIQNIFCLLAKKVRTVNLFIKIPHLNPKFFEMNFNLAFNLKMVNAGKMRLRQNLACAIRKDAILNCKDFNND